MANAMESLFSGSYHTVRLTRIQQLDKQLLGLRFEGNFTASKRIFVPGNVIEFRVSDTEFRHYTPSLFDAKEGIVEAIFYLHDKGPGSKWLEELQEGATLKLLGPGGRMKYDPAASEHFVFGDETSLGLMQCMSNAAALAGKNCTCVAELDAGHLNWPQLIGVPAIPVLKDEQHEHASAIPQIQIFLNRIYKSEAAFYLSGNAGSIKTARKYLLEQNIQAAQIQTDPYWAAGKTGL